jgi:hypothetical protein
MLGLSERGTVSNQPFRSKRPRGVLTRIDHKSGNRQARACEQGADDGTAAVD